MKKSTLVCAMAGTFLFAGCGNLSKTMFTHIRIDNMETAWIAKGNAFTNFCLSQNAVNRQAAFDFSTVAAEMLDLVVFNNDFYKSTYESTIADINAAQKREPGGSQEFCKSLSDKLPEVTAKVTSNYRNYAQQLGVARSEDYQRLAQSMRNFQVPMTPMPQVAQPSFPNLNYAQEQSQSFNVLINSGSGITQCRVTKNNFVFCL